MNNLEIPRDLPNGAVLYIDNTNEDSLDELLTKAQRQGFNCLDLSKRNLTEFPAQLLEFTSLQYLYLEGNRLRQLPTDLFLRLCNLKWLDLRDNKLVSIPNEGLRTHTSLQYLLLSGNHLRTLPRELGKVKTLSALNLDGNPLDHPPIEIIKQGVKAIQQYLRDELCSDDELSLSDSDDPQQSPKHSPRKSNRLDATDDDDDDDDDDEASLPNLSPLRVQSCKQYERTSYSAHRSVSPPHSAKKPVELPRKTITKQNNDQQRDVYTVQEHALMHAKHRERNHDQEKQAVHMRSFTKSKNNKKPIAPTASLINCRYTRTISKEQLDFIKSLSADYFGKEDEARRGHDRQIHDDIRDITNQMLRRRLQTRGSIFEERRQVKLEIYELRRLVFEGKQHRPPQVTNRPKTVASSHMPYSKKS